MAESKFSDIINSSLQKVKEFTNSETVIGEPIKIGETTIVPVSRISMGFASGGVDSTSKKQEKPKTSFGGGGGTGVSVTPIAFLIVSADGKIDLVPITSPQNVDTVDKIAALIERSPEILENLKNVFKKDKKSAKKEESTEEA